MPDIIQTENFDPNQHNPLSILQIYNGLDCCVTREIFDVIEPQLNDDTRLIYNFQRALQAPALEMMLRGILIDESRKIASISELMHKVNRLRHMLNKVANAIWGKDLNPNSPKQLKAFLYDTLGIPKVYKYYRGTKSVSTNRESLESLQAYFIARPIISMVLLARDLTKRAGTLRTAVDKDGRIRTSYNPCGTKSGRWSSSRNVLGTGTNLQNITQALRYLFIADIGKKMAVLDLEQAESRATGLLVLAAVHDASYLDACELEDLHAHVCSMIWPDAEDIHEIFYRHFSYRDLAKRAGHLTNYCGTPRTLANELKIETSVAETFQYQYFKAFPGIREWHHSVARQIQLHREITTPLGRRRQFWGRVRDDATVRDAVSYGPQSMVGDLLNLGLWRIWKQLGAEIDLLGQVHDAVIIQYPEEREDELLPQARELLEIPVTLKGRTMVIPAEASVGWTWGYADSRNPDGLKGYKGSDKRRRTDNPEDSLLHRIVR